MTNLLTALESLHAANLSHGLHKIMCPFYFLIAPDKVATPCTMKRSVTLPASLLSEKVFITPNALMGPLTWQEID